MPLPKPPKEVPVERSMAVCAPKFAAAIQAMLAELTPLNAMAFETLRTPERQAFLYGFGRDYDDGRGKVTNARTNLNSWHGFGLAVDVVEKDATPWAVPVGFWNQIGEVAKKVGLTWGGKWAKPDLPHVQWGKCPASPTPLDIALAQEQGIQVVWEKYGAI